MTPRSTLPATVVPFPAQAVVLKDGHPITTSLAIAEVFGKLHKNVIRDIRNLDCPPEFNRLNFEPADYIDEKGESRSMYNITKDGMVYLVMGFTGHQAARFKVAYIEAFNALEAQARATSPAVRQALLDSNPAWAIIDRCARGELLNRDLAKVLGCGETTVRRHKSRMAACGLLEVRHG